MVLGRPLPDGRQVFSAAEQAPFPDERRQLLPQAHQPERGYRAVPVVIDLVADGRFHIPHFQPQGTDFSA
jgi:hypothetical protein